MVAVNTDQALAAITDEALFERLATAVLRAANPTYRSLVHTGVNAQGKTIKSLVDGVGFEKGALPPHMIITHHTITARDDLEKKWLHDPSTVKPRGLKPTAPAGDLIKTANLVEQERIHEPNLRATLILTSNKEPSEALVRTVEKAGRDRGLEIDLWSRSRISDFLDHNPNGQWLRHYYLNIYQEQLSVELLHELSKKSLEINRLPDDPAAWIPRILDDELECALVRDVTFIVAGSGQGKSVACYRKLMAHVNNNGFGIILRHEDVAMTSTLEQAIMTTLRQLHPSLSGVGETALSLSTPERPMLLVVEDINRSGNPQSLAEKLAGWSRTSTNDSPHTSSHWHLICPLWPEVITSLGEQVRKCIEPLALFGSVFNESEGCAAVLTRARLNSIELSHLRAREISLALGHDPLLIALYDYGSMPDSHEVIGSFIEGVISRVEFANNDNFASEYRSALRKLAGEMLVNRQIEIAWLEIVDWTGLHGEPLRLLRHLAHQKELLRPTGPSDDQRLSFRHDRVRDWLLADAAADQNRRDCLTDDVLGDPYFAEVMGTILVWEKDNKNLLQRILSLNPLSLFHALRLFGHATEPHHKAILHAINNWLDDPATHGRAKLHLRWEALAMLSGTDSPEVPNLVRKFPDRNTSGQLARLRNGDISGGIDLCSRLEPGTGAPWRDIQLEHARLCHGASLTSALDSILRQSDLDSPGRVGALRLAGHFADPCLALAIERCWNIDDKRQEHLTEYLWAFGECCEDDPPRFLGPVCDAWAALSDQPEKEHGRSPRNAVAAYGIRFAFHQWPPKAAIDYFVQRGSQDDLRGPITFMLHGVDHPRALSFVVRELAAIQKRTEETGSFSSFVMMAKDVWQRAQEGLNRRMSKASRDFLLETWSTETSDKYIRTQAFSLWAATKGSDDIMVLRNAKPSSELDDYILRARLSRGDQQAIPAVLKKLTSDDSGSWWQYCRNIWSPEFTEIIDTFLTRRSAQMDGVWGESVESDWIVPEMIIRLPANEAEELLLKHWGHIRFSPEFVQAALYIATPRLTEAAHASINECPEPAKLLAHLSFRFGIRMKGHPGVTRIAQIRAVSPYLHLLSPMDIGDLWDVCNEQGWFTVRRELLDTHLQPPYLQHKWDADNISLELDKMVSENRLIWLDHWIKDFLKTDVSWAEILSTLTTWLFLRHTSDALRVVASAIEHFGTRNDLSVLTKYCEISTIEAIDLINDTKFSVMRRSIR